MWHEGKGTKNKVFPPWNAESLLPVLPVKNVVIRAAIFDAEGEIFLIQLAVLFAGNQEGSNQQRVYEP